MPAYVVFTDLTLQAIAEVKPADPPGPAADQRHRRRPSSTKYGDDVLAVVAGEEVLHDEAEPILDDVDDET